ncbi:class F sortase [Metabacillus herbersteinensis]|uniref:Class F sortase n=1 Tax=Metabacillus herbersteinensis TaxID=283816 RepID=A0ABV6G9T0_9BACI
MRFLLNIFFILTLLLITGCSSSTENTAEKEESPQDQMDEQKPTVEKQKNEEQDNTEEQISASTTALTPPEGLKLKDDRVGITPTTIEIPSINVNAPIEDVGRIDNGQMGVPEDFNNVGWFEPGAKPGAPGNSVMAGHVDSKTGPAVFYKLDTLKEGDEVIISGKDGEKKTFVVVGSESYPRTDAPVEKIFDFSYGSKLNLITCTGDFNREARTHEERLVVYTELKGS